MPTLRESMAPRPDSLRDLMEGRFLYRFENIALNTERLAVDPRELAAFLDNGGFLLGEFFQSRVNQLF